MKRIRSWNIFIHERTDLSMEIHLDEREHDLYTELLNGLARMPSLSIPIVKKVLPIGDILIVPIAGADAVDTPPTPLVMIERKSLTDLLASITDGRYEEQSFRLLNASGIDPHNIIYLIEGMTSSIKDPDRLRRVYSAMTSIHYFKRMSVLRTWSLYESAELILRMADKLARETQKGSVVGGGGGGSYSQHVATANPIKRANITRENMGEILLCQIPSISIVTARAIMAAFSGNFMEVMTAVQNDDPRLHKIQYDSGGGKMRKISKKCVENMRLLVSK